MGQATDCVEGFENPQLLVGLVARCQAQLVKLKSVELALLERGARRYVSSFLFLAFVE